MPECLLTLISLTPAQLAPIQMLPVAIRPRWDTTPELMAAPVPLSAMTLSPTASVPLRPVSILGLRETQPQLEIEQTLTDSARQP